jgi:hypothetical protein
MIVRVAYKSYYRWKKKEAWYVAKTYPIKQVHVYQARSRVPTNQRSDRLRTQHSDLPKEHKPSSTSMWQRV